MNKPNEYKTIVIGVSLGGMRALPKVLTDVPEGFPLPIVIVQHSHPSGDGGFFARYLDQRCRLNVREAAEKEKLMPGNVYLAPANFHLLIEKDESLRLSDGEKVNHSRPSIDVLFESAADVYGSGAIGVILTGASADGARGLKKIKQKGGLVIVQDPETAEASTMPQAAIKACNVDYILSLEEIPRQLVALIQGE